MSYLSRDTSLEPVNNIHSLPFSRDRRSTAELDPIDATVQNARIITCAVLPLEDMVKSRESFLSIVDNMQMYAPEIGRRYICHSL